MRKTWLVAVPLILAAAWAARPFAAAEPAADPPKDVPKEVRAIEGTYAGAWTMYGIDDKEEVVKRAAWTDTLKTTGTEVKDGRAAVSWVNEQTFEGAKGPPRKTEGKEGYFLAKDGMLGDYFIEMFGQTTRMVRIAENVWSYASAIDARDMAALGFPKGATGQHVLVKVVTKEQGVETHRITRLSTVTWTAKDGKERTLQFVSLQGHHKRQP